MKYWALSAITTPVFASSGKTSSALAQQAFTADLAEF
jgi:hypothetical protein